MQNQEVWGLYPCPVERTSFAEKSSNLNKEMESAEFPMIQ